MKKTLIRYFLIYLGLCPFLLEGQFLTDTSKIFSYYHISEAYYVENDSTVALNNWIEQGANILFLPVTDSMLISIDIGGRDKLFFMGMAVTIENPGFETNRKDAEFYHWTFVSHIKEGLKNAYILKEYITGSLEKKGRKDYVINIVFFDQTELLFNAYELKPKEHGSQ